MSICLKPTRFAPLGGAVLTSKMVKGLVGCTQNS